MKSIGQLINEHKTWGSKFIEKLAAGIKLSFPNAKGYSVQNLQHMAKPAAAYLDEQIVQRNIIPLTQKYYSDAVAIVPIKWYNRCRQEG